MANARVEINQRINETDIYVFSRNSETGLFTYSRPLLIDEANPIAEAVNISIQKEYADAQGLRQGLSIDKKTGALYNMNTFKGILANRELARQSKNTLRFSTILEGLLMHNAKMLPSGELMDFGLALFSIGDPNKKLSESLVAEAQAKNYALPLLASFSALGLNNGGEEYGVTPTLVSGEGISSGADAATMLKERFSYVGKNGVQRLGRSDGDWFAYWYGVDDFLVLCRVGRVSGEASAKNLQDIIQTQIKCNFSRKRKELEQQLTEILNSENECIRSAEKILA